VATSADKFDLIHWHIDWLHLPFARCIKTPCVTTLHGRLDLPFMRAMVQGFKQNPFVSISNNQRTPLPDLNWAATVYHGLPANLLSYRANSAGYLAFLGRFTPEKGPDVAIRVSEGRPDAFAHCRQNSAVVKPDILRTR